MFLFDIIRGVRKNGKEINEEENKNRLSENGENIQKGKIYEKEIIKINKRKETIDKINNDEEKGVKQSMVGFDQKEVQLFYVEELHKEAIRLKHIQELAKVKLPLKGKIEGDDRSYYTVVEKVARTKDEYVVLMQEFENPKYKEKLKVGSKVVFEYSDANGKFSFETTFKGMYKGMLIFSFPQKIERTSGRAAYRVKPDPQEPIEIVIDIPGKGNFKGMCVDINEYGLGLDINSASLPKDKVSKGTIVQLAFRLPRQEGQKRHEWALVSAKGEIRFVGDGEKGTTRLGIQFTETTEEDRKVIRDYWMMRQRQELKRKMEYEL